MCEHVSSADVVLSIDRKGTQLIGTLLSEDGCRFGKESAASASQLVDRLMARIKRSVRLPKIEKRVDIEPGQLITEGASREAQDRRSRARLAAFKHPTSRALAKAVEPFIGMQFALRPSDPGIGGPPLARAVMQNALGIDIGETLLEMIDAPEVPLDMRDPERTLQPGDLLFYVSYAYIPRSVSVYLGKGLIAQSVVVRGVTVDPVPTEIPYYLYLVARRPTR